MNIWAGEFGNAYTARNRVDWQKRIPFWAGIKKVVRRRSFTELGCNAGWNLRALRANVPHYLKYQISGVDLNESAIAEAMEEGLRVYRGGAGGLKHFKAGCVFTCGCLIHVPPCEIEPTMRAIVDASTRYVLAIEYAADEETEVPYRGQRDALWRRPYGKLYEAMGLKLVDCGFLRRDQGFDDCAWWLLEKPQA